ncbi:MAG: flagellar basal body P-ring formation chaperone FlgA [Pseudomonadota bacterium]
MTPMKQLCFFLLSALVAGSACAAWTTPGASTQEIAAAQGTPPAPGITTTVSDPYYQITAADIGKAVAQQMQMQAVAEKVEASLSAGSPNVYHSANHPVQIVIHALQIDPQSKRWQAQAYMVAGGKTEVVKPISGVYGALFDVPVLTRQLGRTDIIEASDLSTRTISERLLRKDTVTDPKSILGQSPRAMISANRPIRLTEISQPIVIKKGQPVQMTYTSPYMSIKTTGVALEDGSKGALIRVKNDKSEKAVSGQVQSAGHVEVNTSL